MKTLIIPSTSGPSTQLRAFARVAMESWKLTFLKPAPLAVNANLAGPEKSSPRDNLPPLKEEANI
jgi:hypothetical protein